MKTDKKEQDLVNTQHSRLDHRFQIKDLTPEKALREITCTDLYGTPLGIPGSEKWARRLSSSIGGKAADILRTYPDTGCVFLSGRDITSVPETKRIIEKIREWNPSAIVAIDFEGGYIRFSHLTPAEIETFKVPPEILAMRDREYTFWVEKWTPPVSLSLFPSAEWIGREYAKVVQSKNINQKKVFLKMMEEYGGSIARYSEYVGINMILGPVLDLADYIAPLGKPAEKASSPRVAPRREWPIAAQDRSYSIYSTPTSELGGAFVSGVRKTAPIAVVPKHFFWNGLSSSDTDVSPGQTEQVPEGARWAIFPFSEHIKKYNFARLRADQIPDALENLDTKKEAEKKYIDQKIQSLETQKARLLSLPKKKQKPKQIKKIDEEITHLRKVKREVIARLSGKIHAIEQSVEKNPYYTDVPVVMSSSIVNNFYDPQIPGVFSVKTLGKLRGEVGTNTKARNGGLGGNGVIISDDLNVPGATTYIKNTSWEKEVLSQGLIRALSGGNDILLIKGVGDRLGEIVESALSQKSPSKGGILISQTKLMESLRRILLLKEDLGLLSSRSIQGETYYEVHPTLYQPSKTLVRRDGYYSNQWPWLLDDASYRAEPNIGAPVWSLQYTIKAVRGYGAILCREDLESLLWKVCQKLTGQFRSHEAIDEKKLPKKFIIIDKSTRRMMIHDLETRFLEAEYEVGIGKGTLDRPGELDRRVVKDYKTPVGNYQITQKKTPKIWKEAEGREMDKEYGGVNGGMLVLSGPWHPEIAIHGTLFETTGKTSNGCIRVSNALMKKLMESIPTGSFVIVTQ